MKNKQLIKELNEEIALLDDMEQKKGAQLEKSEQNALKLKNWYLQEYHERLKLEKIRNVTEEEVSRQFKGKKRGSVAGGFGGFARPEQFGQER